MPAKGDIGWGRGLNTCAQRAQRSGRRTGDHAEELAVRIGQLRAAGVAGVHCDSHLCGYGARTRESRRSGANLLLGGSSSSPAYREVRLGVELLARRRENLLCDWAGDDRSELAQQLGQHGERLSLDPVELIKTGPHARKRNALDKLFESSVVQLVRAVEDNALPRPSLSQIPDGLGLASSCAEVTLKSPPGRPCGGGRVLAGGSAGVGRRGVPAGPAGAASELLAKPERMEM